MKPLPNLMSAPNGARKTKADHPAVPLTLDETVATAIACHAAGADGLHLHVRDENGGHTLDAGRYREAIAALRDAVPNMQCQITTEEVGLYSPAQQRQTVWDVQPEAVSVSLAEMLRDGDASVACGFYTDCATADIAVQHILYNAHDLAILSQLLASGHLPTNGLQLLFVLGRYTENQESTPADLQVFTQWLNTLDFTPDWAICAFGKQETACLQAAHRLGGKQRVGFENSVWNADGTCASSNEERVAEVFKNTK